MSRVSRIHIKIRLLNFTKLRHQEKSHCSDFMREHLSEECSGVVTTVKRAAVILVTTPRLHNTADHPI